MDVDEDIHDWDDQEVRGFSDAATSPHTPFFKLSAIIVLKMNRILLSKYSIVKPHGSYELNDVEGRIMGTRPTISLACEGSQAPWELLYQLQSALSITG